MVCTKSTMDDRIWDLPDDDAEEINRDTWEPGTETPERSEQRQQVMWTADVHVAVSKSLEALGTHPNVYQRAGALVEVRREGGRKDAVDRPEQAARIIPLARGRLRTELCSVAQIKEVRTDRKGNRIVAIPPPAALLESIQHAGDYPSIRHLAGITEVPTIRSDGSILDTPGYDEPTGLIFTPRVEYPQIPSRPTHQQATDAAGKLLDLVGDFPFASTAHAAAWVAGVLTLIARDSIPGSTPLFTIDAATRGTGKGLLCDVGAVIGTGQRLPVSTYSRDDAECRKAITALARAGDRAVLLDNIGGVLGNPALDAALTGTVWRERLLGGNEIPTYPLRLTWFATGNNIVLAGDTARRVCHIRLESKLECPEERDDFQRPQLLEYVKDHQPELTAAALTCLAGWYAAGKPDMGLRPWGSFEGWSAIIRNAVVWLGLPDPGDTRYQLRERSDSDAATLAMLIEGWEEIDPCRKGITVKRAMDLLEANPAEYETLRCAIAEIGNGKPSTRSIGRHLAKMYRRVSGGKYLDSDPTNKSAKRWVVRDA